MHEVPLLSDEYKILFQRLIAANSLDPNVAKALAIFFQFLENSCKRKMLTVEMVYSTYEDTINISFSLAELSILEIRAPCDIMKGNFQRCVVVLFLHNI